MRIRASREAKPAAGRPGADVSHPRDFLEKDAARTADRALGGDAMQASWSGASAAEAGGLALPRAARGHFEARLGRDLGGVRIHDDGAAHAEADSLGARAFTRGKDISFAQGQFAPHTEDGRRLLAHELAHVAQQGRAGHDMERIYRETWDVDDAGRTVEREVLVQLIFEDTWEDWWNGTGWTSARKNTFRSGFESSIENTFNHSGTALYPPADAVDVLPHANIEQGYRPLVDISLVPDGETSTAEDWEVEVESNAAGVANPSTGYRTSSSNRSYGYLNEATNLPVAKAPGAPGTTQIPTVHEFGHFIGLDHPGEGLGGWFEDPLSPGADEYSHTGTDQHGRAVDGPNDLMGGAMGLRHFYFDAWSEALDEHIEELREAAEDVRDAEAWDEFWRDLTGPGMGDFPVPVPGDTGHG